VRLGIAAGGDGISQRSVGYRVVDSQTTSVTFDVTRPTGTVVVCSVRALSQSWAEVGVASIVVDASSAATTRVTTDISTVQRPVTAEVVDCTRQ